MKKAFFVNGGAGRVLCAIPALEHYLKTVDSDVVIVAEAWLELFLSSDVLRNNVYSIMQKDLFRDKLKDKEIVTPEPYRLNAYFNQKANLIQAFDMLINDVSEIPETKNINLSIGKADQALGYNLINNVREQFKKEKVIVFQPFGSGARQEGNFIIDESGRSFELKDIYRLVDELSKNYGIIMMSTFNIPSVRPMPAIIPEKFNLLQWTGVINAADYFLGCDSVGQHFAHALKKPATVVIGSTFPQNISYPNNKDFTIIDNGKDRRTYSPLRITTDFTVDRNNEDLMILEDKEFDKIVDGIVKKLGKSTKKFNESSSTPLLSNQSTCGIPQVELQKTTLDTTIKNIFEKTN